MKNKVLQNLSANTLQLIVNQLAGLVIFYLLSTGLSKNDFGQLNLALAILLFVFNILSAGIDQVSVRKIASGDNAESLLSTYLNHVLVTGSLFYILLGTGILLATQEDGIYSVLLVVGAGKLMIYFSTPFKQLISGLERFKVLAFMLTISNLARGLGLTVLFYLNLLSLQTSALIFVTGDAIEFAFCIFLFKRNTKIPVKIRWGKTGYFALLRESLPQTGVTILTSAIARFDWIFIGLMVSATKLAEYSFAYKVFEIATFPLLAIAPLLIPRFTKMFMHDGIDTTELKFLIRIELIIAAFTTLILNIAWAPVIDAATVGKYGAVNVSTIYILSMCIPFLYLNNFFWSIYFAQGHMRMILKGFVITFVVNAGLDVLLIPFIGNEGAAIAFLAGCVVQAVFYTSQNRIPELNRVWFQLIICLSSAILSGFLVQKFFTNFILACISGVILFSALMLVTFQIRLNDSKNAGKIFTT